MKVYTYGNPAAATVLIRPADEREITGLEAETEALRQSSAKDFSLLAVQIENWNTALSPWEAPPVFGRAGFGSGAAQTLRDILALCGDDDKTYILGGYSLATLFSLWAAFQTDRFAAIAAASPSVWFPGFLDYVRQNEIKTRAVYLSLGDTEEKTNHPVLATVGDCIRITHALLEAKGVNTALVRNPGNHFKDAQKRTAAAFSWALQTQRT